MSESNERDMFRIHPVPFTDRFTIDLGGLAQVLAVEVRDASGRIQATELTCAGASTSVRMDAAPGMYVVLVRDDHGRVIASRSVVKE
ncbi:MAG: T9SS type A sorting domain-containing protein [Flavobacteriales bacterium]